MAIRRIGSTRLPDNKDNVWNAAPRHTPGDVLAGAPGYGGQELREAPGPIITESHMVAMEPPVAKKRGRPAKKDKAAVSPSIAPVPPAQAKASPRKAKAEPKAPRKVKAVVADSADLRLAAPKRPKKENVPINLRMPADVLAKFKEGGRGYQTRIIAALRAFWENGGEFIAA